MESQVIPVDQTKRLPFEILGKIFLLLGESPKGRISELKKCRQVSPRWYKVVQDLFQDEFSQKLLTHYDGNNQTFASSKAFGQNLFGSYKFNFPMLKISNAEFHLMKSWLANVTLENNVQFLELKDNFLDFLDLFFTLLKFQNVQTIKVVQTSKDMKMAEKVRQFYQMKSSSYINTIKEVMRRLNKTHNIKFLHHRHLKSIKFEIVHPSVLNYFCQLVGSLTECELENLSIKFDFYGLFKSAENDIKIIDEKEMKIWIFEHLKYMSKSLKSLEFTIGSNIENYDALPEITSIYSVINDVSYGISSSILDLFAYGMDFRKIENLIIDIPKINFTINYDTMYFQVFVKKQRNLKNFYSSLYYGWTFEDDMEFRQATFRKFIKNNGKESSTFGFHISHFLPNFLTQLTEHLSVIDIRLDNQSTWRFSDAQVPIFPNCKEMKIKVYPYSPAEIWPDFEVPVIFQKFPNLEILKIRKFEVGQNSNTIAQFSPHISHNDFQFILKNCTNLKHLYLTHCFERETFTDSTFTGLSIEAKVNHLNNPDLVIKPEELEGVPISNLKKLEVLVVKDAFDKLTDITDFSALYGFDQMPELKYLEIRGTQITKEGYSIIKEKSRSENMKTPYLGENEWSMFTRNPIKTRQLGRWTIHQN